jgi:hypothetical protein
MTVYTIVWAYFTALCGDMVMEMARSLPVDKESKKKRKKKKLGSLVHVSTLEPLL